MVETDRRLLQLAIFWDEVTRDWYCPDVGLHGSQLPPATRALLPPPPGTSDPAP